MAAETDGPADQARVDKVRGQLDGQIIEYEGSLYHNRKVAFQFKIFEVSLGAATTVMVGLSSSKILNDNAHPYWSNYVSAAALVMSAALTIVTALENFRGYRDNWIRYANTWSSLRMIRADLDRKTAGANMITRKALKDIEDRFDNVLADSHAGWGKHHK